MSENKSTKEGSNVAAEEIRAPEPYYRIFVFLALVVGLLYWRLAATQRADLDLEEGGNFLYGTCGGVENVARMCHTVSEQDQGKGGKLLPTKNVQFYVTLVGAGEDVAVPSGFEQAIRRDVLDKIGTAFEGSRHHVEYLTRTRDRFPVGAKVTKQLGFFEEKALRADAKKIKQGEMARRSVKIVNAVAKNIPEPLNTLSSPEITIVKIVVVIASYNNATSTKASLSASDDHMPQFHCGVDSDDVLRGGCLLALDPTVAEKNNATAELVANGVASVVAQILRLPNFKVIAISEWTNTQDMKACCSAHHNLVTFKHLLDSVSGMPIPEAAAQLWGEFMTALSHRRLVDAALSIDQLVNSPNLMPHLVLPYDQNMALHLPVVLPIGFSLLTGGLFILKRKRLAKKQAAEEAAAKKED